jgi:hypothetical protein
MRISKSLAFSWVRRQPYILTVLHVTEADPGEWVRG